MKIVLLEHPRTVTPDRCNDIANTPLSSCLISGYIAGLLRERNHDVEIIEGYLDGLTYEAIGQRITSLSPDIFGVHMIYHWKQDLALFSFLNRLRRNSPRPLIIAYGFYATISADKILPQCPAIDGIILGEAELPFAALADAVTEQLPLSTIPGLGIRTPAGGMHALPQEPMRDLDAMPFPVRTEALYRLQEVNILGSRGCYGRCTFCYINGYYGRGVPWRGRSPENIAAEISGIISERGIREFYFTDPNFFGPGSAGQERAMKIATLLRPLGITFGIEGRVNDIHDRTIEALVAAGLRHILIGLESGRDESLRRMNKMTTVADNERALRILRKHGIEPNVGFIMFEPDSTLEDIRANFEFLKRNELLRNLPVTTNVLYHHQIVLEGTQAFHTLKKQDRLIASGTHYEGSVQLKYPQVALLADIMRQVTNLLFNLMDGIWSGRLCEPPDMQHRYDAINSLLVGMFDRNLQALESGHLPDAAEISSQVRNAESSIARTMRNSHAI